jgi:hypothetical protein
MYNAVATPVALLRVSVADCTTTFTIEGTDAWWIDQAHIGCGIAMAVQLSDFASSCNSRRVTSCDRLIAIRHSFNTTTLCNVIRRCGYLIRWWDYLIRHFGPFQYSQNTIRRFDPSYSFLGNTSYDATKLDSYCSGILFGCYSSTSRISGNTACLRDMVMPITNGGAKPCELWDQADCNSA